MIKFVRSCMLYLISLVCMMSSYRSYAQVQTARYIAMTNKVNGFYEYLPKGYSSGTGTFRLLIFLTGIGEYGDGSPSQLPLVLKNGTPKLINDGTFPVSFTVNGVTTNFIVITPQFTPSPLPNANNVDDVINYCFSHYRVNKNKVYVTGLSYGGGLVWAYAGGNTIYSKKVAAILPVASATNPDSIYKRSRIIAAANIPVWALHNRSDSSTPFNLIQTYINDINIAPAPSPKAKLTAFYSASHDAWTRSYDPNYREDGINVYEWMLQFTLGVPHPIPPVDYKKYIRVNLYGGVNPIAAIPGKVWNNWNVPTANYVSSGPLKYNNGTSSGISVTLTNSKGIVDNGAFYGSGMAPDTVLRYASYSTTQRMLTFYGLSPSKTYGLELYGSTKTAGYSTIFIINGKNDTVATYNNYLNKAVFTNLKSTSTGQLVVGIKTIGTYNYLNGFSLYTDTTAGTLPITIDSSAFVRVNVYGGTNPTKNLKWNNWNTGTASVSNSSSGILKYSNGTSSGISAVLSVTNGLTDNGAGYGGGMAPDTVLRYGSYASVQRTLTFSGLVTTKKYSFEFYSSKLAAGYNTVFTINGKSDTVLSSYNLIDKAPFTAIAPDVTGKIVVTIRGLNTYNYLNGFMMWASTATTPETVQVRENINALSPDNGSHSVEVYPNPIGSSLKFQLNNQYRGQVKIQLYHEDGSLVRSWQVNKDLENVQLNLPVGNISAGYYVMKLQMGNTVETRKVIK